MISIKLQRKLRNYYYRHVAGNKENEFYSLFSAMYHYESTPFPWLSLYLLDKKEVFIASHFISASLSQYCGLELVAFSSNRLACYWLPGAHTQAKGEVKPGNYKIKLNLLDESSLSYMDIKKTNEGLIDIQFISTPVTNSHEYEFLPCNLLRYHVFQIELKALIEHWLGNLSTIDKHDRHFKTQDVIDLNSILKKCYSLSESLAVKASKVQALINLRKPCGTDN